MDLDILEPVAEFLMEFAPQFIVGLFEVHESVPPARISLKSGIQTLFGTDEWWNER